MDSKVFNNRRIILASGSPRRKEILENAGIKFEIIPSKKDEIITESAPDKIVMSLSAMKAEDIYNLERPEKDYFIIGSDTMVFYNDKKYGKPADKEDAFAMLKSLSGNVHQVYTGVTFVYDDEEEKKVYSFSCATDVTMYEMSDEEIWDYIETGEPMDKAGAYAIQGLCAKHIKEIKGEYNNVVGLPIAHIFEHIKKLTRE